MITPILAIVMIIVSTWVAFGGQSEYSLFVEWLTKGSPYITTAVICVVLADGFDRIVRALKK